MGRGRQKAKATKQARDIKYYSPSTDYAALERELGSQTGHTSHRYAEEPEQDDSEYADQFGGEDEDEDSRRIG
ncbi:DUF3073 domain-containing protein [Sinomonas sp. ASV486]|uniref:DUF3073 domain-containing protein n=1 Tax=Sinomonas puerhi TaxID=3238584 RepID=A0AB39L1I5_9MICC|nr:DUF3073 domain-containing protein [Sinomonas sp. ASV486]MDQ4488947.1 DUF3073 domain-containing protein [Sinomonas sp. ASV486]